MAIQRFGTTGVISSPFPARLVVTIPLSLCERPAEV
jgi:hypothetical protein